MLEASTPALPDIKGYPVGGPEEIPYLHQARIHAHDHLLPSPHTTSSDDRSPNMFHLPRSTRGISDQDQHQSVLLLIPCVPFSPYPTILLLCNS